MVYGGGRRGRSEVESLTPSPSPQPHSDWLSSSLQATTAGHFPYDHLREQGRAPETQAADSFTGSRLQARAPYVPLVFLFAAFCRLQSQGRSKERTLSLEKSQSWTSLWVPDRQVSSSLHISAHCLYRPAWVRFLCGTNVYMSW